MRTFGLVAFSAVSTVSAVTPVQKVIQLLNDMRDTSIKEKNEEEVKQSAYAQWCENTARVKTDDINMKGEHIEKLAAQIAKHYDNADKAAAIIGEEEEDIQYAKADMKAAAEIRAKEKVDFQATNQDYSESLDALDRAIKVLKEQPSKTPDAGLLQENLSLLQKSSSKVHVVRAAKAALTTFLSSQEQGPDMNPKAHVYETQNGGVIDILETLKDEFRNERTNLQKEEANAQHSYEQMSQVSHDEIEGSQANIDHQTKVKSENLEDAKDKEGTKKKTESDKAADEKYLADKQQLCQDKARAFEQRQELRAGEIEAINQATEILASKSVSGAADEHLPSFLQVKSASKVRNIQQKVAMLLQESGEKFNSNLLSMLATRAESDPFVKVKKMIKEMILKLMRQATEETEHKGWCDGELGANKITRDDLNGEIEELNSIKDELEANIAQLSEEITQLTQEMKDLNADRAKTTEQRNNDKAKNTKAIADAKAAQSAVTQATEILREFYSKAATATALVQEQYDPEATAAPETFNESYQGAQTSNNNVIAFLEVILTDFARLESETSASEETQSQEFTKFMNDSEIDLAVKNTNKNSAEKARTSKMSELEDTKQELKTKGEELDAADAYYQKLKPSCVDSGITYEERVQRREEEIQSLNEALEMLQAGNEGNDQA